MTTSLPRIGPIITCSPRTNSRRSAAQRLRADRLDEVAVGAHLQRALPVERVGGAGEHDDGDALGPAVGAQVLKEVEAGAVGAEADVDDGDVGRLLAGG